MKEKCIFKNPKIAMVILVMALMIAGALNVYSASFAMMGYGKGYFSGYIARYLLFGVIGLILMGWLGWKMDYHQLLGRRAEMAIAFINIVLLVAVDLAGHTAKGAQRWLSLGPVSFQPSELAKLAIILLGAAYLGKVMEQGKKPSLVNHFSFAVVIIGLLVFKQPDMGTSAILIAIAFFLYILAGLPTLMVIGTILIGAVGAVVGVVIAPYRLNRIYVWLDPSEIPKVSATKWSSQRWPLAVVDLAVLGLARGWENIFIFLKPTRTLLFPYSVRNTVFWARSSSLSFFSCLDM